MNLAKRAMTPRFWVYILSLAAVSGCAGWLPAQTAARGPQGAFEVTSGLGRALYALPDDQNVVDARKALAVDPKSVDRVLALSKAQAARRQYREAVATSTRGLTFAPNLPAQNRADLYLERGHRELGLREFAKAKSDLEQATRLAPQMLDAYYHLGLSHYFLGEFDAAAAAFTQARDLAKTNDSLIDCSNWMYVSLRRAGKQQAATDVLTRITPDVKNTEPHLLFYLRLLHFYQGKLTEQEVLPVRPADPTDLESELSFDTATYGVGNWRLYHGDRAGATELFRKVVEGQAWNAWGFIGSETDLVRARR